MSAIFVVGIVAQIGMMSLFLMFPGRAGLKRTFLSFAECCSLVMFFPFGLQERVSTHTPHITEYGMVAVEVNPLTLKIQSRPMVTIKSKSKVVQGMACSTLF